MAANPSSPTGSGQSPHRQFELLIADAQRQFESNGKVQNLSFWSYKVMCRAYIPGYQNPPLFPNAPGAAGPAPGKPQNFIDSGAGYVDYCSWHRYSDFEWLLEQLQTDLPGEIFPPLPPKENDATKDKVQDLVSNTASDNAKSVPFVQARIRWLNMWAQVLMEMPHVHDTPHLKAFLAMEEPQWHHYRDQVNAQRHGTGVSGVASRLSSFFGKVTAKPVVVYDANSDLGRISEAHERLANHFKLCQYRMKDVENIALNQAKTLNTLGDTLLENAGKPLPLPLVTGGHFVSMGNKRNGLVRHVTPDGQWAFVEWNAQDDRGVMVPTGQGIERVEANKLEYPQNGICDPVIFAAAEASTQLESFFAYIQHRSDARDLEKLVDLLSFWRCFCDLIVATIKRVADIEVKRFNAAEDLRKTSDATKKQAKQQEVDELAAKFDKAEQTFKKQFAYFYRPLQRRGLYNINLLVGRVGHKLMDDEEWESRFAPCDRALNPDFDTPAEVTELMQQLANGAPPPAAVAPTAPPQVQQQQQQYQQQAPAPAVQAAPRASSTAVTEDASPVRASGPSPTTQQAPASAAKPVVVSPGPNDSMSSSPGAEAAPAPAPKAAAASPSPKRSNTMFENSSEDDA